MDIYDQATVREEQERDIALRTIRSRNRELIHSGTCHNCVAEIPAPKIFCDAECRDDWQKRIKSK